MSYIVAAVLCLITFLFFTYVPPFIPKGEELLHNTHFGNQLNNWTTRGKGVRYADDRYKRTVLIESQSTTHSSAIYQRHKKTDLPQRVILSALIKTTGVLEGKKKWNKARLLFVGVDTDNKRLWNISHTVISLTGTKQWQRYSKSFETFKNADAINYDILADLNTKGKIWLNDISLKAAAPNPVFPSLRFFLIFLWGIFIIYLLFALSKKYRHVSSRSSIARLIAPITLIALLTLLALLTILPVKPTATGSYIGHFTGFFIFSLITLLIFDKRPYKILLALILLAIATETLQYFTPARTPDIDDVITNFIGIIFGFIVFNLQRKLKQKKRLPPPLKKR